MSILKLGKRFVERSFSTSAAGFYIILFALAIGVATFIENDFGTSAAQKLVYKARWFELLLVLFSITLIVNIFKFRMVKQKKWALLIFHAAMVIIIIGAGITRFFGYEGTMHIREGGSANTIYSSDAYFNFTATSGGQQYAFHEPILIASLGKNHFEKEYKINGHVVGVTLDQVVPNPVNVLVESNTGKPTIKIVFGGASGRSEYFLQEGEQNRFGGVRFNFSETLIPNAINIYRENDELRIFADVPMEQTIMRDRSQASLEAGIAYPLQLRALYSCAYGQFVFGDYVAQASLSQQSEGQKIDRNSTVALKLNVTIDGQRSEKWLYGTAGYTGDPVFFGADDLQLSVAYGARIIQIPFSLQLHDFIMDRYPGTNSPASYASEVTLNDPRDGHTLDYRIYMNHILNYDGYRFFQSSYDQDEKGTYLSVNHDYWGSLVTYIGYALLTLGMIMIFFSKKTRFHQLATSIKKLREQRLSAIAFGILFTLIAPQHAFAQHEHGDVVSAAHAEKFSHIIVQDFRGRMKPVHTLTRELLRKVNGSETIEGHTADQVVLSMYVEPAAWYGKPIIKIGKSEDVGRLLGISGKRASYRDFFNEDGSYKLNEELVRANNMAPEDRGVFENQLIKLDERVNIVDMIFSGSLLRIIPQVNDPNNTWVADHRGRHNHQPNETAEAFFGAYQAALHDGLAHNSYSDADKLIDDLAAYQKQVGGEIAPAEEKVKAEIFLNNAKIFNRLAVYYPLLGILYLIFLFVSVFRPAIRLKRIYIILTTLVILGFVFQTLGLGLRWYVSGRAPWSNGYESMIYIAWTAALAGLLFARKSLGGMAATMVLSGTVLLIAMLSYLDPEITPLVPVLRSYWLTIHVSLEAGSYGFLMLGAIIGFINLLLLMFINVVNKARVMAIVKEMSYMSEMTIIGGIVMLSVGTYLGGVWANESWGRYWGWDAKETWALVSILVYAFILHMRLIPGLGGIYQFNVATLFGLSSIIMTYFGVNYYLSGLHSYAAGDPVPIPSWVYISVVSLIIISLLAYVRYRRVVRTA